MINKVNLCVVSSDIKTGFGWFLSGSDKKQNKKKTATVQPLEGRQQPLCLSPHPACSDTHMKQAKQARCELQPL